MQKLLFPLLFIYSVSLSGQSKSIDRFRKEYKEDNNVFIYSSTLQMLDPAKNPDFSDLVKDIEEIRVLHYNKANRAFKPEEFTDLKTRLKTENFQELMLISEQGNKIFLFGQEKREKMVGLVALIENAETYTIIDVVGGLDFKKFMELKSKLDTKL